MEEPAPPFSARAVASLSRQTGLGEVSVATMCEVFGVSKSGYYAAALRLAEEAAVREGDIEVVEAPLGELVPSAPDDIKPRRAAEPAPDQGEAPAAAKGNPASRVNVGSGRGVNVETLVAAIEKLVKAQPAWGVRKVWASLRRGPDALRVSRRRVWAVMRARGWTLPADGGGRAEPRRGSVVVPEPNRRWSTDFTTVWTEEDRWVAVAVVIDCGCRTLLELEVTKPQDAPAIMSPVERAMEAHFGHPAEVPDGLEIRTDHGPQYTGADFAAFCRRWGLYHTLAPVGRPTGNAPSERVIRTMKEECIWQRDWKNLEELRDALAAWRLAYNGERPHQSLDWQTPDERRAARLSHQAVAA